VVTWILGFLFGFGLLVFLAMTFVGGESDMPPGERR
jgi:hypothetical protein